MMTNKDKYEYIRKRAIKLKILSRDVQNLIMNGPQHISEAELEIIYQKIARLYD